MGMPYPTITLISPVASSTVQRNTPIVVEVYDPNGIGPMGLGVVYDTLTPADAEQVYRDLDFTARFKRLSSTSDVTAGTRRQYTCIRDGGWKAAPRIVLTDYTINHADQHGPSGSMPLESANLKLTRTTPHIAPTSATVGGFIDGIDSAIASAGAVPSSTTPAAIAATGAVGVGTTFARADHVHSGVVASDLPVASSSTPAAVAGAGAVGVGTTFARADHVHSGVVSGDLPIAASATPLAVASAGVVGTATKYAREDHVHAKFPYLVDWRGTNTNPLVGTAADILFTNGGTWTVTPSMTVTANANVPGGYTLVFKGTSTTVNQLAVWFLNATCPTRYSIEARVLSVASPAGWGFGLLCDSASSGSGYLVESGQGACINAGVFTGGGTALSGWVSGATGIQTWRSTVEWDSSYRFHYTGQGHSETGSTGALRSNNQTKYGSLVTQGAANRVGVYMRFTGGTPATLTLSGLRLVDET